MSDIFEEYKNGVVDFEAAVEDSSFAGGAIGLSLKTKQNKSVAPRSFSKAVKIQPKGQPAPTGAGPFQMSKARPPKPASLGPGWDSEWSSVTNSWLPVPTKKAQLFGMKSEVNRASGIVNSKKLQAPALGLSSSALKGLAKKSFAPSAMAPAPFKLSPNALNRIVAPAARTQTDDGFKATGGGSYDFAETTDPGYTYGDTDQTETAADDFAVETKQWDELEPEEEIAVSEIVTPSRAMVVRTDVANFEKPRPVTVWEKILDIFGLFKPKSESTMAGESKRAAVESVVFRARQGDQNAMALIQLVRENAITGDPNAQESYALIDSYTRKNPA